METRFLQRGMLVNVLGDLCVVIGSETEVTGGIGAAREGPLYGMYMGDYWYTYDEDGVLVACPQKNS